MDLDLFKFVADHNNEISSNPNGAVSTNLFLFKRIFLKMAFFVPEILTQEVIDRSLKYSEV